MFKGDPNRILRQSGTGESAGRIQKGRFYKKYTMAIYSNLGSNTKRLQYNYHRFGGVKNREQ